jgi:hypothetical protein
VHLIALDFSKAFDTVRHSTMMEKFSNFPIPDNVYNWVVNFLSDRCHHTRFNGILSAIAFISASIVQGSVIGPCSFVMEASDLQPQNLINLLLKYADDTDLVVPASHSHTVQVELDGISRWASDNNLTLNVSKSREMIIRGPRIPPDFPSIPPPVPDLARVSALEVLGVSFSDRLDFSEHFKVVCAKAARSMYALKVLRAHGLQGANLWQVCRATTISYLTYAAPAWWGFTDACARLRLQSVLNRLRRFGLLPPEFPTHEELCEHLCGELFRQVLNNRMHVLHQLLPPVKETPYGLRPSSHNRIIPRADNRFRRNFIIRMLYK